MAEWGLNSRPTKTLHTLRGNNSAPGSVTVTASATPHTKGAWAEIIASTPGRSSLVRLLMGATSTSGTATDVLLDIGVGAAGAEQVLIPNLLAGYLDLIVLQSGLLLPLRVPPGSRLAARAQSVIASKTVQVCMDIYGGSTFDGDRAVTQVDAYGVNLGTSRGTVVTAHALANTKGDWTDIVLSTPKAIKQIILLAQPAGRVVTAVQNNLFDIGVWNGLTYDVVAPDLYVRYSNVEVISYDGAEAVYPLGFSLPPGSRLGARVSSSVASTTWDVALYGMG